MNEYLIIGPASPWRGGIAETANSLVDELEADVVTFSTWPGQHPKRTPTMIINPYNPLTWKSWDYETVVFQYWHPVSVILASIARRSGKRTVGIFHNAYPHEHTQAEYFALKYALSCADGVVCFSDFVGKQLHRPYRRTLLPPFKSLSPAIPKREAQRLLKWKGKNILFFGNRRDYKGLEMLNATRFLLHDPGINIQVVGGHYGDGANWVDDPTYYFSAADAVIIPYTSATQSAVIPMAFHYGKPVITTDVGGLTEYVTDGVNGIVSKPTSTDLARSIFKFYELGYEKHLSKGARAYNGNWMHVASAIRDSAEQQK